MMGSDRCLYVDYDDVLCETAREMTGVARREFGRTVSFEDIGHFDLRRSFQLDPVEYERFMSIVHTPEFLDSLEPLDGCCRVLTHWQHEGYTIHVVTGRPPASHEVSQRWLRRYAIPFSRLIFVDKYDRAHTPVAGVDSIPLAALTRMEFRLAVEDAPDMIHTLSGCATYPIALLDRPWNRRLKDGPNVTRCRDWLDILERHRGTLCTHDDR